MKSKLNEIEIIDIYNHFLDHRYRTVIVNKERIYWFVWVRRIVDFFSGRGRLFKLCLTNATSLAHDWLIMERAHHGKRGYISSAEELAGPPGLAARAPSRVFRERSRSEGHVYPFTVSNDVRCCLNLEDTKVRYSAICGVYCYR